MNISRLSGPVNAFFVQFTIDGETFLLQAFSDVHFSLHNTCEDCRTRECSTISEYLLQNLARTEVATHVFVESMFITRNKTQLTAPMPTDFLSIVRQDLETHTRRARFHNGFVHYTDFRFTGLLARITIDDAVLYTGIASDCPTWTTAVNHLFQLMIWSDNFEVSLCELFPKIQQRCNEKLKGIWWQQEVSLNEETGGAYIHKISKEIRKIELPVARKVVLAFARICQNRLCDLSYFRTEEPTLGQRILRAFEQPTTRGHTINLYIGSALLEIYTMARMFHCFDTNEPGQLRNMMLYFGDAHIMHFYDLFIPLVKEHSDAFKSIRKPDDIGDNDRLVSRCLRFREDEHIYVNLKRVL